MKTQPGYIRKLSKIYAECKQGNSKNNKARKTGSFASKKTKNIKL